MLVPEDGDEDIKFLICTDAATAQDT